MIGVLEPGAAAACAATRSGHIAVIATEGTVRGGAYQAAIRARRPDARVTALACQVFVALAEEGWTNGEVPLAATRRYLGELFAGRGADSPDTIVLGCTHFPMLVEPIRAVVGADVAIVDSAATVAAATRSTLLELGLSATEGATTGPGAEGTLTLLATDLPERFARVGSAFLGGEIGAAQIELVDLDPAQSGSA